MWGFFQPCFSLKTWGWGVSGWGSVSCPCRTKAYLVLILSCKSYQTCLHKGRLEANLCLSRATRLCTPHKQWNVCVCHCLPLHWFFIHFMIKSKFSLSLWSAASVKQHWRTHIDLNEAKDFQVLWFFSKPLICLLQPVSKTSSCIFASWIPHLFLSLMFFPASILTLLLYHLTPVGYGACGKEMAYYKKNTLVTLHTPPRVSWHRTCRNPD